MEITQQVSLKKAASRLGMGYFVVMMITQLLSTVLSVVLQFAAPQILELPFAIWLISYLPLYGVGFPIFLLIVKSVPNFSAQTDTAKVTFGAVAKCITICFGAMYIFNFVSIGINTLLGFVFGSPMVNPLEQMILSNGVIYNIIFGVIVAPIGEEIMFRYIPYKKMGIYGDKMYIVFSSLCFALFHGNISQMLYAFVLGAIFAYVMCRTGKIRYTIILHIVINAVGMVLAPLMAGNAILLALLGLFIVVVIIAGIVVFVRVIKTRQLHFNLPISELPVYPWKTAFVNPGMLLNIAICAVLVLIVIVAPLFV